MSERGKRTWLLRAADYESDDAFREGVAAELAGLENVGHRLGGGFIVSPIREEYRDDTGIKEYMTVGWMFEHTFMPAVRQRPAPEVEPEVTADDLQLRHPEPVEA